MTDYKALLRLLGASGVEFVLIGEVAGAAHGSASSTAVLDMVYRRTPANLARLAECLGPYSPYLRGAPPGLHFRLDTHTLKRGLNFTLTSRLGDIDLLGEIAGGGGYDQLLPRSFEMEFLGVPCRILELDHLIHVKRAAGRPKDIEAIAELEALLEESRGQTTS